MSYVEKVLHPDERVIAMGRKHWIIYGRGIGFAIFGIAAIAFGGGIGGQPGFYISVAGGLILAFALLMIVAAWFEAWTTEIAVTNHRVIQKTGFISRTTSEMNMDKVETVSVNQSVLGRILNYGSLVVRGTGAGMEGLRFIDKPLELRGAIIVRDQPTKPST
jgi:uncharacterized membrane protein YdbT with pleckstrin-like domain